jgi:hypothetical protein
MNLTRTDLESNSGLSDGRPAINRLSYGTVLVEIKKKTNVFNDLL